MILLLLYALLFLRFRWMRVLTFIIVVPLLVIGVLTLVITGEVSNHATYR